MTALHTLLTCAALLSAWTSADALDCGKTQRVDDGRCCDLCPPGQFMTNFCTKKRNTECSPCPKGTFSRAYGSFDRCEKCKSCPQGHSAKCSSTADANCTCRSGFLCSNSVCSSCQENPCAAGERAVRTGQSVYSYHCDACKTHEYLDEKVGICRPMTKCQTFGQKELFGGNTTHDAICRRHDGSEGYYLIVVVVSCCFVLVSLTLFVLLTQKCVKNIRKQKNKILGFHTSACECHLSKEESGNDLKFHDDSTSSGSLLQLQTITLV